MSHSQYIKDTRPTNLVQPYEYSKLIVVRQSIIQEGYAGGDGAVHTYPQVRRLDCPFLSLENAVTAAYANNMYDATIVVMPGVYREDHQIVIHPEFNLTIKFEPGVTILFNEGSIGGTEPVFIMESGASLTLIGEGGSPNISSIIKTTNLPIIKVNLNCTLSVIGMKLRSDANTNIIIDQSVDNLRLNILDSILIANRSVTAVTGEYAWGNICNPFYNNSTFTSNYIQVRKSWLIVTGQDTANIYLPTEPTVSPYLVNNLIIENSFLLSLVDSINSNSFGIMTQNTLNVIMSGVVHYSNSYQYSGCSSVCLYQPDGLNSYNTFTQLGVNVSNVQFYLADSDGHIGTSGLITTTSLPKDNQNLPDFRGFIPS